MQIEDKGGRGRHGIFIAVQLGLGGDHLFAEHSYILEQVCSIKWKHSAVHCNVVNKDTIVSPKLFVLAL